MEQKNYFHFSFFAWCCFCEWTSARLLCAGPGVLCVCVTLWQILESRTTLAVDINDSKDEKFRKVQTINIIITGKREEQGGRPQTANVKFFWWRASWNVFKGESTSTTKRAREGGGRRRAAGEIYFALSSKRCFKKKKLKNKTKRKVS